MINYTVDLSVFAIPKDIFQTAGEDERKALIEKVRRTMTHYRNLEHAHNSSYYFPMFSPDESLDILVSNNALTCRELLDDINQIAPGFLSGYFDMHNEILKIVSEKHREYQKKKAKEEKDQQKMQGIQKKPDPRPEPFFFNSQFLFQYLYLKTMDFTGTSPSLATEVDTDMNKSIVAIAIMNEQVHIGNDRHFVITRLFGDRDEVEFKSKIGSLGWCDEFPKMRTLMNVASFSNMTISGCVRRKSPEDIGRYSQKPWTLKEMVDKVKARNKFGNLFFEPSVDDGIKDVNETAGPPDRIYHYLKTLNETTKIMNNVYGYSLIFLGRMYGLDCSDESYGTKQCQKAIRERQFNKTDSNQVFFPHLKSSYLRVHFYWDAAIQKTRVGWIGKHLHTVEEPGRIEPCCHTCNNNSCKHYKYLHSSLTMSPSTYKV